MLRLAATIGVLLDVLDALVAVSSDMPRLRAAPIAQEMLKLMGGLYRAGAQDIQHLSLDLLAHQKPRMPRDHTLAHDDLQREAARVAALEETDARPAPPSSRPRAVWPSRASGSCAWRRPCATMRRRKRRSGRWIFPRSKPLGCTIRAS